MPQTPIFCVFLLSSLAGGCTAAQPIPAHADRQYSVKLTSRERWPQGVPMRVRLEYKGPLMRDDVLYVVASPRFSGAKAVREWVPPASWRVSYTPEHMFGDRTEEIGAPPASMSQIRFDVVVNQRGLAIGNPLWRDRITLPYRAVETIDDVLTPVHSPELDAALQEQMRLVVGPTTLTAGGVYHKPPPWYVHVREMPPFSPLLDGVTFAVRFEIMREDERIATATAWWEQYMYHGRQGQMMMTRGDWQEYRAAKLEGDLDRLRQIEGDTARWWIRVTPEPLLALRNFESDRYWRGELRFPMKVEITENVRFDRDVMRWESRTRVLYDATSAAHLPSRGR